MTTDIKYCFEDEDIEHVIRNMGDQQIRRLPVLNRQKRLVGVLALCDVAASCDHEPVGDALSQISRPGGAHTQADGALH
jgi:CBS-domain-containing membrane protein